MRTPPSSAAAVVEAICSGSRPLSIITMIYSLDFVLCNGVANKYFFMGGDTPNWHKSRLVNMTAFLAQR